MDYERMLINRIATNGKVEKLLEAGIREEHFADWDSKQIYRFIVAHTTKYRIPPSIMTLRKEFPERDFSMINESVDYLVDEFTREVMRRHAIEAVRQLATQLDNDDIDNIHKTFIQKSQELSTLVPKAQVSRFKDIDQRIESYLSGSDLEKGIKMGIPEFDAITGGIQAHEYVTISGWSGTGKSTLAQWILFNAWMQGKTPMYISLEMEAKALFRKWDTMLTHFNYSALKAGMLREDEIALWRQKAETEVHPKPNDIIVADDVMGCDVAHIYSEIVRWKPDILCIDYISLMKTDSRGGAQMWEKVTNLTRELKSLARTLKTPIIGVAQTNRESAHGGAQLDNIAYSVSVIQDSDIVLGLHQTDEMKMERQMEVRLQKNRDGMTTSETLEWRMDTMYFGPWTPEAQFRMNRQAPEGDEDGQNQLPG